VGLLDASEEPTSKRRHYAVAVVALVILVAFGAWYAWYLYFLMPERQTVEHFMNAVVAENLQRAYQIWKPHANSYTFDEFTSDWGTTGYYGPIKSFRIESARQPPESNGVVVMVEISPYQPFPARNDPRSGRDREVSLWVDRGDHSLSFPP
jgi:hypothetical protein